jgi:hypothetical protein
MSNGLLDHHSSWTNPLLPPLHLFLASTVYSWMVLANFLPVLFACALWFGMDGDRAPLAGFAGLFGSMLVGVLVTAYFLKEKMQEEPSRWTWGSIWWEVTFSNIFALKDRVEPTIQNIPNLWAYLIKGVIPHLLIIVFVNAAATKVDGEAIFGNYGGYPMKPYQVMGFVCIAFALALFVVGFFFPHIFAFLATAFEDEHRSEGRKVKDVVGSDETDEVVAAAKDEDEKKSAVVDNAVEVES